MAEAVERFRHLFLSGTGVREQYTNPRQGGGRPKFPPRDRTAHGNRLLRQLETVREQAAALGQTRTAFGLDAKKGICIQFDSEADYGLTLDSLEDGRQGIELLSIRQRDKVVSATVYVPEGKIGSFIRRVEQYLTESTQKGLPRNQRLIESISEIRTAVLEAFWTDMPSLLPPQKEAVWWEVWLRATNDPDQMLVAFRADAARTGLRIGSTDLRFPDRIVVLAHGTREQMSRSVELLNAIAELRLARIRTQDFTELTPVEQAEWVEDLRQRTTPPGETAPAVCLIDTGVNRQHPLLAVGLSEADCHAHHPDWGTADHDGHGTEMAGVALYGDLAEVLASPDVIVLSHCLESVKILPPPGFPPTEPHLYGAVTEQAVARVEIEAPSRKRIVYMAATAAVPDHLQPQETVSKPESDVLIREINQFRGRGQPSSWSAAIDKLSSGADDDQRRLLFLAAGNTALPFRRYYPDSNLVESVHDPAQAWNALTVGAYTTKCDIDPHNYPGWQTVAPAGGLSPSSTTSLVWQEQWPLKPDLCMEGGNMAIDPSSGQPDYLDNLQLLTTNRNLTQRLLTTTGDTSAAAALASRMAAIIQAEYPQIWPETVRALMVHSAEWTPAMQPQGQAWPPPRATIKQMLRTHGYGVPDLGRALWSARNTLTLIVQDSLQPFDQDEKGRYVTRDMHLHKLPWPTDALRELEHETVELHVTLSYFIEPNPGERGWRRRYRYASHGLRFDVKTPTETEEDFKKRLSKSVREEEETGSSTSSDAERWLLGPDLRHKGSILSDRWQGTARELADRGILAVFPVIGWWRERPRHERWNRQARYAFIVSIRTRTSDVDIYTPVAVQIQTETAIET